MNSQLAKASPIQDDVLFEKVILNNDVAGLSPIQKVQHVKNVCESLGLNPLTKPIQIHKFDGKEMMYVSKDGTEQLRNIHGVSIVNLETTVSDKLYIVKAFAERANGRKDVSTSVKSIEGLKGKALENAMKVCETQAKRRVTLSICGLGMLDESELGDLIAPPQKIKAAPQKQLIESSFSDDLQEDLLKISQSLSIDELQDIFKVAYTKYAKARDQEAIAKIMNAKDKRKDELQAIVKEFNDEIDSQTGEVINHE